MAGLIDYCHVAPIDAAHDLARAVGPAQRSAAAAAGVSEAGGGDARP